MYTVHYNYQILLNFHATELSWFSWVFSHTQNYSPMQHTHSKESCHCNKMAVTRIRITLKSENIKLDTDIECGNFLLSASLDQALVQWPSANTKTSKSRKAKICKNFTQQKLKRIQYICMMYVNTNVYIQCV